MDKGYILILGYGLLCFFMGYGLAFFSFIIN